uniref:Uncharacterized protein n=1 Tax=Rhizophora mucronata TaxID=61149 RepID=A0A2P2NW34_RHIMU
MGKMWVFNKKQVRYK